MGKVWWNRLDFTFWNPSGDQTHHTFTSNFTLTLHIDKYSWPFLVHVGAPSADLTNRGSKITLGWVLVEFTDAEPMDMNGQLKDLSMLECWYPWGSWRESPADTKRWLYTYLKYSLLITGSLSWMSFNKKNFKCFRSMFLSFISKTEAWYYYETN